MSNCPTCGKPMDEGDRSVRDAATIQFLSTALQHPSREDLVRALELFGIEDPEEWIR